MALPASEVLIVIAEISVALLGFSGIIAVFRQRSISSWPPHIGYRFLFMCWNAFYAMAFALLPFILYYTDRLSGKTWQISSALYFGATICFMIFVFLKAKKLSAESRAQLSSGWMLTYQTGLALVALILAANGLSLLGTAGPAPYLIALAWQLFLGASLFARLLMGPGGDTA